MSQTHARSAGKNTCREVKFRHRVYSYVRYSKVLDSDMHVEANKKEGVYKTRNYQIPLNRIVGTPGPKMLMSARWLARHRTDLGHSSGFSRQKELS